MSYLEYVLAGWGVALGVLGLYAQRLVARGRRLSVMVPEHRRRWIDADE